MAGNPRMSGSPLHGWVCVLLFVVNKKKYGDRWCVKLLLSLCNKRFFAAQKRVFTKLSRPPIEKDGVDRWVDSADFPTLDLRR